MTEKPSRPIGRRFSLLYRERGDPTADSAEARRRIGIFVRRELGSSTSWIAHAMGTELGPEPAVLSSYMGIEAHDWDSFFTHLKGDQFLDAVWAVALGLDRHAREGDSPAKGIAQRSKEAFIAFARRVFDEENLAFEIDDGGGIHPRVDVVFHNDIAELIRHLNAPAYANAKRHFEAALQNLDSRPPDTRAAVRCAFETVEEIFQLIVGDKLNRGNLEKKLVPAMLAAYPSDDSETWDRIVRGWADWVDGIHRYRHAQGGAVPAQPSQTLCVSTLSTAASIARTLLDVHSRNAP